MTPWPFLGRAGRRRDRPAQPRGTLNFELKARIHELTPRRTSGWSLERTIRKLNEVLRGWHGYFRHSHWTTFPGLDSYARSRLRSILRARQGKRGRARGTDHQRWPNHYFAKLGLLSLRSAHAEAVFSLRHGATH